MIIERNPAPARRFVYCSIAAQSDNLGDIEIRRALLARLAESGLQLIVFTGGMPDSYVRSFRLPSNARLISDPLMFQMRYMADAVRGRASLLFAPGPYIATATPTALMKSLVNQLNVRLAAVRGGRVVAVGRAFRVRSVVARRIERSSLRRFDLIAVRDDVSSDELGMLMRQEPDLAMLEPFHRPELANARYLAVSLRSDRHVSISLLADLRDSAGRQGLEMIFVTQVQRDAAGHRALASELGVRVLDWSEQEHSTQESRVLDIYRESAVIVSNRLHAVLMAARHGVVPVTFSGDGTNKIASTVGRDLPLRFIRVDATGRSLDPIDGSILFHRDQSDVDEIEHAFAAARARLNRLTGELLRCLRE